MLRRKNGALVVLEDGTLVLDAAHAAAEEAREALASFAELVKRPGTMHTYKMTPLSVWNAASQGMTAEEMLDRLDKHSRYGIPGAAASRMRLWLDRYGELELTAADEGWLSLAGPTARLQEIPDELIGSWQGERAESGILIPAEARGELKRELLRLGMPVRDQVGYKEGEALRLELRAELPSGRPFRLRGYQQQAVERFCSDGVQGEGGSGVIVLPCGAGKTIVGIAALARLGCATLVLTSGSTSVRQWKRELLGKTTIREEDIGEYTGEIKQVRPVTIASYQILAHRGNQGKSGHMDLFGRRDWGLIVYDEVHLLPAPVFRLTAELQATRRLGLTATLVREDGRAEDVFSLIGPKLFEAPWKALEREGWIAEVTCREIRVPLAEDCSSTYGSAGIRSQLRMAAVNPLKAEMVRRLLSRHPGKPALVIGQYLDQLSELGRELNAPVLSGSTTTEDREVLYNRFNSGALPVLVVSKVANFAIDMPDAAVAIQVSGSFGSRQEEAQRIGRLLRPKDDNRAYFYTVVTEGTRETEFASKRQLFMIQQGYSYEIAEEGAF